MNTSPTIRSLRNKVTGHAADDSERSADLHRLHHLVGPSYYGAAAPVLAFVPVPGHAGVVQNASSTRMGQTEARPLAGSISLRCVLGGTHIDDLADDAHPQPNLPALSHRLMDLSGRRTYLKPL